jgi:DNA-binding NtrC family response regulator
MSQARVLLVDDDADLLDLARESIVDYFDEVWTARNFAQAQSIVDKKGVDIIVCDFRTRRTDSVELRDYIQKKYPHIQLVMLSEPLNSSAG